MDGRLMDRSRQWLDGATKDWESWHAQGIAYMSSSKFVEADDETE